jgi:hypothetical protein
MAGIIMLDKIDAAPLQNEKFSYPFNAWVANVVDVLNEVIEDIQNQLNGFGTATFITPLTTTEIDNLIDMNSLPVLPVGALWYDTTLNKLRVLTTAAVYQTSNGVTQVVTSV